MEIFNSFFMIEYIIKQFKQNGYECFDVNTYPKILHDRIGYVKTSAHLKPYGTAFSKQSLKQMKKFIEKQKPMTIIINEYNDIEFYFKDDMEKLLKNVTEYGYIKLNNIEDEHLILADIQKWFRDNKKIYVQPILRAQLAIELGWVYEISTEEINDDSYDTFETYEECLKQGLLSASDL
jgi:hypothetical protein